MKAIFRMALALTAVLSLTTGATAQCPFNPSVTGEFLLCPESSSTLSTQQYDGYQWYTRPFGSNDPAQPVGGATGQNFEVNYGSTPVYVSVAATLDGCTEQSPEVLVDGLAFLPVVVASSGEFDISDEGELVICSGDTVFFVAQLPYTLNFKWYRNQVLLPGETDDTLIVTGPGNYWLTASPEECPHWTNSLGLEIPVIWGNTPGCVTSVKDPENTLDAEIAPNPALDKLQISVADFAPVSLILLDTQGKIVREREFAEETELDVSDLPRGVYVLNLNSKNGKAVRKIVLE